MATRRAARQLLPLRPCASLIFSYISRIPRAASTPSPFSICLKGTRSQGVRWYSKNENENEVPNSRIYSFDEMKKLVEAKDENVVIIDVREPGELLQTGRIPGAINIPITTAVQSFHVSDQDFQDMYGFERPAKDANLVFYCRAGVRARGAAGLAQHAGWTSVGEYPGSWLDWEANQGPVEKV